VSSLSTLTIDCAFKVLRYKTAFQEMLELRQKNQVDRMVGEIVMTTYNKKFYKVEKVNTQMNAKSTFTNEKQEVCSFAEYYKKRYNLDIKNPDAPLLEASIREKNKGSKEAVTRIIQLIPELCQMTGLTDELRNNFHAMKAIATTTKPNGNTRI
jgi:aubergine-like protein